ncbi:MAG TPA: hypothetical protein VE046_07940 [Steroidobacteraceae bacterium]|nr:hypothetical protein [Steroidobacteraceae bacterium]
MPFLPIILFMCLVGGMFMLAVLLRRGFSGTRAPRSDDPYEYLVSRAKNRRITRVRLALDAPDGLRFVLRREKFYDRCGKALGLAREWETHDREFDESIFILSDDRVLCEALSVDEELRRAVMTLFKDPQMRSVECAGGRIWIVLVPVAQDHGKLPDLLVAEALMPLYRPLLARVRDRLVDLHARAWDGERDPGDSRSRTMMFVATGVGVAGMVAFVLQMNQAALPRQLIYEHIDHLAAVLAGSVVVIALLALFLLVGRTSRTHLVAFALLLALAPASWLAGRYGYTYRNEKLDAGPATDYLTRIDDTYSRSGKSRSYYLVVHAWPDGRFEQTLQVKSAVFSAFKAGDCARFELHGGSLGDPWLAAIEPDSRCDPP